MSTSPRRLGKYELYQPIGRGRVGEVWKAHDMAAKKDVALKILHSDLQADPHFLDRFANASQTLTALRHDNLVSIYDVVVTRPEQARETTAYIAMDYIDGYTLTNFLQATSHRGIFSPIAEIAYLFTNLAATIDYLHQKNVVHGDIKPDNILLDKQHRSLFKAGEPMLTDVSITQIAGNDSQLSAPQYISPEQAQGQQPTWSSDIYALGILLYEICTGAVPFRGENSYAVIAQQINTLPVPPMLINPNIPPALSNVILRAIAKDTRTRFPSASAFADAISEACSLQPTFRSNQSATLSYPGNLGNNTRVPSLSQPLSILGVPQPQIPETPVFTPALPSISQPLQVPLIPGTPGLAETAQKRQQDDKERSAKLPGIKLSEQSGQGSPESKTSHAATPEETVQPQSSSSQFPGPRGPMSLPGGIFAPQSRATSQPLPPAQQSSQQPWTPTQQGPQSYANQPELPNPGMSQHYSSSYQQQPYQNNPSMGSNASYQQPQQPQQVQQSQQPQQVQQPRPNAVPLTKPRNTTSMYAAIIAVGVIFIIIIASVLGNALFNGNSQTTNSSNQQPTTTGNANPSNAVFFQDDALGHNDQIHITLQHVSAPATGEVYDAWLQSDQQQTVLLGQLPVQNQQVDYTYTGNSQHTNLLANLQGVIITQEKAGGTPSAPGSQVLYHAQFDQAIIKDLRAILYQTPELHNSNAIASTLFETIKSLNDKTASITDSLQNTGDTGLATRQATRVIEMIDGTNYAVTSGHQPTRLTSQLNISIGLLSSPTQPGLIDIFDQHLDSLKAHAGGNASLLMRIQNVKNALSDLRTWTTQMETYDSQLLAASSTPARLTQTDMRNIALQLKQKSIDAYIGRTVPPNNGPTTDAGSAGAQQAYNESQYMASLNFVKGQ